jgi:3-oxoisoapionate kinase
MDPSNAPTWPDGPLLAYVGDDFTGSTDAMEAFTAAGIPTVLFLRMPQAHWMKRFAGMRCMGLATTARSQSPIWMETHLAAAFSAMKAFGAPILHYKICSTFDSSPTVGSIGRATEIGTAEMPGTWSPMIVAAPRLRRFQAFGNLFAIADGHGHRLDRHPTMSRHPVTPMPEADLTRHLAQQTSLQIALIDFNAIKTGLADRQLSQIKEGHTPVVLMDVLDEETLVEAGRLVWENREQGLFSASSSGLQDALAAHWRNIGLLPETLGLPVARPAEAIAVISGSCAPATAFQIAHAIHQGFVPLRLDIESVLARECQDGEIARLVTAAVDALVEGKSPLVFSAQGPDDPAVIGFDAMANGQHLSRSEAADRVGTALGVVLRGIIARVPTLQRFVVAGGDSSGAVANALDIAALTIAAGLSPGAPLCRIWSDDPALDGREIVLKGGQMGDADFFVKALEGTAPAGAAD